MTNMPYRIMVVDDSAATRHILSRLLQVKSHLKITDIARDGHDALMRLARQSHEVMILDLDMPGMDGLALLPHVMRLDDTLSVLILSGLSSKNAEISRHALRAGALDYMMKPIASTPEKLLAFQNELIEKVTALGVLARQRRQNRLTRQQSKRKLPRTVDKKWPKPAVIAIGASTGGPEALFSLLEHLDPAITQPIVITQHMPAVFTPVLAQHLARHTNRQVIEAKPNATLDDNTVIIAPGDHHLIFNRVEGIVRTHLVQTAPVHYCRPAFDVMLRSLIDVYDNRVLALLLSGMGTDGRDSCYDLFIRGGPVMAQNEESSVVWGMPGAVAVSGICAAIEDPAHLAQKIAQVAG